MHERGEYHYHEDVNWGLLRLWGKRTGLRVLDVGCGFATTSARIQQLGNQVTGIDSSPEIEAVAAKRLTRVVHGDVLDVDLGDAQFDVIIFADVLEHLPWPVSALKRYLRWLAPGGSVLVSLPNVGLWSVRFAHLLGRWEYDETGVLDRTHLRFFTRRSARWLIGEAGLTVTRTTYNPGLVRPFVPLAKHMLNAGRASARPAPPERRAEARPAFVPDALLNSRAYKTYLKTLYPLERAAASLWPGMLAFQMIFEAKR
ncbi:MAG TPA: class I SAM-dependent methyltransferase [Thermoanaerobaculia bacterium]|nr:class I SAM-dependent methyltransferase [Thermoanaerobaculia bacterium]